MPTIHHLLGIKAQDYIQFGTDLFSNDTDRVVAFRNGDFFTKDYAMVKGVYYDNHTGEEIEANDELESIKEKVEHRSEEHTSELQSRGHLVCRLLLEKKYVK